MEEKQSLATLPANMFFHSFPSYREATSYLYSQDNNSFYLIDAPGPEGALSIINYLKSNNISPDYILLTHGHFDHILGLGEILKAFPKAKVYIDKEDLKLVEDKGKLNKLFLGNISEDEEYKKAFSSLPESFNFYKDKIGPFEVIRTPGHTDGSVCLLDKENKVCFTGDTLFNLSVGRTDLGGSYSSLINSLDLLKELDDETKIFPGHGPFSSIKFEKENNPYL